MLPPEGPNQMSTCGEKRPLDDSQRQSVLVKPANNTNTENIRGNKALLCLKHASENQFLHY